MIQMKDKPKRVILVNCKITADLDSDWHKDDVEKIINEALRTYKVPELRIESNEDILFGGMTLLERNKYA